MPYPRELLDVDRIHEEPDALLQVQLSIRFVETLLDERKFDIFDQALRRFDPDRLNGSSVLALLALSRFEKDALPSRPDFLRRCEAKFVEMYGVSGAEQLLKARR